MELNNLLYFNVGFKINRNDLVDIKEVFWLKIINKIVNY